MPDYENEYKRKKNYNYRALSCSVDPRIIGNPIIQDFAWDGGDLFALTSYKRNKGFGDLWIYNTKLHRGFKANPIDGRCCYRDPVFSPDGKYLAFVFQDADLAINEPAKLFYIPFEALDISLVYPPIPNPARRIGTKPIFSWSSTPGAVSSGVFTEIGFVIKSAVAS